MLTEESLFRNIAGKLASENQSIYTGKMMSSPGIKYKNKVFAFYHNKEMIFKLGKQFDPKLLGIEHFQLLSPFKNKPPMAGWFQIPFEYSDKWEELARQALALVSKEIDKE
jgi:hypothetical protein